MKHLRYILRGDVFDFTPLEKLPPVAIIIGIAAIGALLFFLSAALLMDAGRLVRLNYLLWQRRRERIRYAAAVYLSLGHPITRDGIKLLLAA